MSRLPKLKTDAAVQWRALLADPGAQWLALPVLTRAIAAEMLRRLDHENAIVATRGEAAWQAVSRAIAADPRERRIIKRALEELADGGWLDVQTDRCVAYFPDLGRARAPRREDDSAATGPRPDGDATTTAPRPDRDATATEPRRDNDRTTTDARPISDGQNSVTPTHDTNSDVESREEKRRVEERGGEETRARGEPPPARTWVGRREVIRAAFVEGFRGTGAIAPPWVLGLTNREWGELDSWLTSAFEGREAETARRLGDGFARHAFAKRRGYPFRGSGGLIEQPGEFLGASGYVRPEDVKHTTTSDEDFEKAMAAR